MTQDSSKGKVPPPLSAISIRGVGNVYPIESIRALAVLMLVAYHVIGSSPEAGLHLRYPHPLRILADFLVDVRMPLFAMISGIVYTLRPVQPEHIGAFAIGKIRRLVLPGAVAITLFAFFSSLFPSKFSPENFLSIYFYPYAHFWYLQAILVIFATYCVFDIFTRGRFLLSTFGLAMALLISPLTITNFFSISSALYLLPYFILGMVLSRRHEYIQSAYPLILILATIFLAVGFAMKIHGYEHSGVFSADRRDVRSLLAGLGVCTFAALAVPSLKALDWIGPPSFVIYLYHVLGTSGMRQLLDYLHIKSITVHMIMGTLAGILFGYGIYQIAQFHPLARLIVCGQRPSVPPRNAA
jgi:peptidoglycan/LPS O-acetylase OafA/YrhL